MKFAFSLFVFLFPLAAQAIINGTPAPEHSVILRSTVQIHGEHSKNADETCTGIIISRRQILTAGHCGGYRDKQNTWVNFYSKQGKFDRSMLAASGIVHPKFWEEHTEEVIAIEERLGIVNPASYQNDIAVLTLEQDIPEGALIANILPDDTLITEGAEIGVAGYGVTEFALANRTEITELQTLRLAKMTVGSIHGNVVLTLPINGGNTAPGDSGGPVFKIIEGKIYVWGITSYGAANNAYVVRINRFRSFIKKLIRIENAVQAKR